VKIPVAIILSALALAASAQARPNVVLVVTDDQRFDTLAAMPIVQAELVAKGVSFDNAFVVNPLCCPSRATILTGTYSHTNGVWSNFGPYGGWGPFRPWEPGTIAVALQAAGYRTGFVGKYLNTYSGTTVPPGWHRWFAFSPANALNYFDYDLNVDGQLEERGSEEANYSTDVLAAETERFVRAEARPFFLAVFPFAPHRPFTPAPRHAEVPVEWQPSAPSFNEEDVSDKPRYVRDHPLLDGKALVVDQVRALLAVDDLVQRLVLALEETGALANTVIVFTSDNGYTWGEHRLWNKMSPYEESIRVPLVVRADGRALAGVHDDRPVANVDLAATIAELAEIPFWSEGRSLLPLLRGESPSWRSRLLVEGARYPGSFGTPVPPSYCSLRDDAWKYVQYATGEEELYDLAQDPHELANTMASRRWMIIDYRKRIRRSACRPPEFTPLPPCTLIGTSAPDRIVGTTERDWICAGRGGDFINVRRGGRDVVRCGRGFDRVRASQNDRLFGCEA
jgi:N-acetylglucosamine-6-sulfatase